MGSRLCCMLAQASPPFWPCFISNDFFFPKSGSQWPNWTDVVWGLWATGWETTGGWLQMSAANWLTHSVSERARPFLQYNSIHSHNLLHIPDLPETLCLMQPTHEIYLVIARVLKIRSMQSTYCLLFIPTGKVWLTQQQFIQISTSKLPLDSTILKHLRI